MKRIERILAVVAAVGALAVIGLGVPGVVASASPLSDVPSMALGIRDHPNGQFESAMGVPVYLGTVDATTTSKTNWEATTSFGSTGLCGKVLLIQNAGSVDIRLLPTGNADGGVSNTRNALFGPAISAGERVVVYMEGSTRCHMAVIATTSTANVDFWELR